MRGYGGWFRAPCNHTRTSELLLPPSTGRSWISATFNPDRAADTAAQVPAIPPPTTTRSKSPASSGCSGRFNWARRKRVNSGSRSGGVNSGSAEKRWRRSARRNRSDRAIHLDRRPLQSTDPPVLPMPCRRPRCRIRFPAGAVDQYLEPPRRTGRLPRRHPVAGPHPDAVLSGTWQSDRRPCVFDRFAQSMSQQERRTHLVHELRIGQPAAQVVELLGFDQHRPRLSRGHRTGQQRNTISQPAVMGFLLIWWYAALGRGRDNLKRGPLQCTAVSRAATAERRRFGLGWLLRLDVRGLGIGRLFHAGCHQVHADDFTCGPTAD
jgi:hypothetical protein